MWVSTCKDVCQQAIIVGRKIVAYSGLEPALSSTPDHRSDALPSALLRRYEVLDLTKLNVVSG